MNSLGLDPRLTLAIYIGGALVLLAALLTMFIYGKRMKINKNAPSREDQIARATEKGKKF